MSEQFTPQSYIRYLILCNGAIDYDEAIVKWKRMFQNEENIPVKQNLYQNRNALRTKYGVVDLTQLPVKPNGTPNIAGLARLLLKKNPSLDRDKCQALLANDGVTLTRENWRVIVPVASKEQPVKSKAPKTTKTPSFASDVMEGLPDGDPDNSPDENQKRGHRAKLTRVKWIGKSRDNPPLPSVVIEPGKPEKTKAVATVRSEVEIDFETELSELESRLDLMIEKSSVINAEMLNDLRKARRLISKSILEVAE